MLKRMFVGLMAMVMIFSMTGMASAVIIDFTGGKAYLVGGGAPIITNNTVTAATAWGATDYYVENGFKLDFIGEGGIIGDYYGGGNDVIHGHWATGNFGTLTEIRISKTDNTTFDLNYFELTSNTDTGGDHASGAENAYIAAYDSSNVQIGTSVKLQSDDWGWSGNNPQVFLGSDFDNASWVSIFVTNKVDCFGMDMFYIDEDAPPAVPEPGTIVLMGMGILGLVGFRVRQKRLS